MAPPYYSTPSYNGITITSGEQEMTPPNYSTPIYNGITITSGVQEMTLPNSIAPTHDATHVFTKSVVKTYHCL
jgi:hypothetical protein